MKFVGLPYRWGGDDPMAGFDCSGLAQEILAAVGADPPGDQTAQALYNWFKMVGSYGSKGLGALVFFGRSEHRISHVGFMLNDSIMLEAGGGGSSVLAESDAITKNAYVRIRPVKARRDFIAAIMPDYN